MSTECVPCINIFVGIAEGRIFLSDIPAGHRSWLHVPAYVPGCVVPDLQAVRYLQALAVKGQDAVQWWQTSCCRQRG